MTTNYHDQATELRELIQRSQGSRPRESNAVARNRSARTIAVTSGKGGVGKSVVALNLAIALANQNKRVCLFDADLGLGNLDLMCGLNGYWNLSHVLSGSRSLSEIMLDGPAGISILPGASGLVELADTAQGDRSQLLQQLAELDDDFDFLILDCGTGIHHGTRQFAISADTVLLLSTLETTSLADTYAALKIYHSSQLADVRVVLNRCAVRDAQQVITNLKKTSRQFLQTDVQILGCVPDDETIRRSIATRKPAMMMDAQSPACEAISQIGRLMATQSNTYLPAAVQPFVTRLFPKPIAAA
ncbi:P-loop NTPase [Rubinisphaera sp.]|uniref:P-loop NTPase n=1 Tax=Rubinisphaera sp. TaxID=2024857 RepID=UPI000C118A5F|nr:P-loop NTPase [Rubinisphaera sp.]MBV07747.1 hypothetical protein [Rubinisphaera sp.]HCS51076.1 hypothetical protein [Planctomycetaceae bacterium]|tara:strand:+ start:15349 stop:16254 length:906 start_codon:yes stop_codon:yes gene_type:complete